MHLALKRHGHERGDTIVEVLIVLAVLGLAIGISYATANRSLLNARQAQENATASKLLQSQIESLRVLAPVNPGVFDNGPYCIRNNTISTSDCVFDDLYTVKITHVSSGGLETFTLVANWDDVLGNGTDTVTTVYRLYK